MVALGLIASLGAAEAGFRQVRVGRAVVSLPDGWTRLGPVVPVWLHLHGAPASVETSFSAIGAPGVLVNVTLPGLSRVYADHFAEPRVLPQLLGEVEAVLRHESDAHRWTLGPLTVSSFSAGFGGVRALLRQPGAVARIAVLIMADSLYCGYAGAAPAQHVDPQLMEGFLRFAQLAARGERRMLVTHSEQVPEGYGSTTETADFLIAGVGGKREIAGREWSATLRQLSRYSQGGLEIIGFAGSGPEDHLEHLRSLGRWWGQVRRPAGAAPE